MKRYVDCDGVIFDSEILLFDDEYRSLKIQEEFSKIKYIQTMIMTISHNYLIGITKMIWRNIPII